MVITNIGTSTFAQATAYGGQRKIVKSSSGELLAFAMTSNMVIAYERSADNGVTWSGSWTTVFTSDKALLRFDVYIDTNDDILLTFQRTYYDDTSFMRLVWSSGNVWTPGTRYTVSDVSAGDGGLSITKRSDGKIWIGGCAGNHFNYTYSSNDSTWAGGSKVYDPGSPRDIILIPKGTYIWAIVMSPSLGELKVYQYDSSFDSGTSIDTGLSDVTISAVKISDSDIFVAARSASGIVVYRYTGSWDGGTSISDNANDTTPSLINYVTRPAIIWNDYDGSNYNIAYRRFNGSTWNTQIDITSDTDVNTYPSVIVSDEEYISLLYTTGASSPYDINFATDNPTKRKNITSDVKFVNRNQETILSDVKFIVRNQKTILSDVKFVTQVLSNINNKVNTVIRVLSDVNNKVNTAIRVLSDINNFVNTCKLAISDVNNDIRTKGLGLYNATNDVRFLYDWQQAADGSFQSLGKGYIKVYISTVEQTDVDINSISINKTLNSAHTASFSLGRAYDSTKPTIESVVEIKYHTWTLFKGYITAISPADSPENMRIECQDEFWKQNQTDVHFQVGQKPIQSDDLFYDTIKTAVNSEYSWILPAGDFVPETINCNDTGKSDALNNLISNIGNYAWFYDVDGSKKIWIAGEGSIIDIERQTLGSNLKLFDLISHQFSEDISELTNQYRVQMGEKVINETRTVAQYSSYRQFLIPAWDASYEVLAKDSVDGEGVDYHSSENANDFAEVFKKYTMPYLDPTLSSWSDVYAPYLEIYSINSQAFGFVGEMGLDYVMTLTEGFTIDYDKKTITLTEPLFLYRENGEGEITAIRAPIIKAFLWKKNYYTYSSTVTNPLEFDTPVMGSYPTTIKKDLELSSLTIQTSQRYIYYKGIQYYVAPYDDTQYALDIANWNLSKICDKRITGTIELTLDALVYNNIDLTKRIFIDGITDAPMNIQSIDYDINNFTVRIRLQNNRAYTRTVSLPYRGEE